MANEQNLIPQAHKLTEEEASKGGKKSGETRRRKRDIRRALEAMLEKDYRDKDGKKLSGAEALATAMMKKALEGNVNAFTAVRDTVGQAPVQKIETVNISQETREDVQELIDGIKERRAGGSSGDAEPICE